MAFLFSGLYEPIPDIDLYLERINYNGDRTPTLNNLNKLIQKNLTHIPYGNLDFYPVQNCPSLAIPDIFEKLIISHGCGGCFEINMLFFELLKSLGYELFPVIVKCIFGSDDPIVPTHCATIVSINDIHYYVDVGLGNSSPVVPVALDEFSQWQPADFSTYYYSYKVNRQGNTILLEGNNGSHQMSMVSFVLEPAEVVDFIPLHFYGCLSETSPVRQGYIVTIFKENGAAQIVKDRLTIRSGDTVEEIKLETDDEFNNALEKIFGIRYKIQSINT